VFWAIGLALKFLPTALGVSLLSSICRCRPASDTSIPPYLAFQFESLASDAPCLSARSVALAPASCSRRIPMICSSVKLTRVICPTLVWPDSQKSAEEQRCGRSSLATTSMLLQSCQAPLGCRALVLPCRESRNIILNFAFAIFHAQFWETAASCLYMDFNTFSEKHFLKW